MRSVVSCNVLKYRVSCSQHKSRKHDYGDNMVATVLSRFGYALSIASTVGVVEGGPGLWRAKLGGLLTGTM